MQRRNNKALLHKALFGAGLADSIRMRGLSRGRPLAASGMARKVTVTRSAVPEFPKSGSYCSHKAGKAIVDPINNKRIRVDVFSSMHLINQSQMLH